MEKFDNKQQNRVTEKDLDQVSGGVNDLPTNQLYQNGNEIDLFHPDFLFYSKKLKQ